MKGYWFCNDDTLNYGDDRKARVGITHRVDCDPKLCRRGLHASAHVFDALKYAPGHILYRVELSDGVVRGNDKAVARERKYLARIDVTDLLWKFSRMCALDVIDKWDAPDAFVKFLKTGDESLRDAAGTATFDAARDAARAATRAAGCDAAGAAARAAARDAAWAAAGEAVRGAAWAAAWAAAGQAAWDAARKKQRARLARMVNREFAKQ